MKTIPSDRPTIWENQHAALTQTILELQEQVNGSVSIDPIKQQIDRGSNVNTDNTDDANKDNDKIRELLQQNIKDYADTLALLDKFFRTFFEFLHRAKNENETEPLRLGSNMHIVATKSQFGYHSNFLLKNLIQHVSIDFDRIQNAYYQRFGRTGRTETKDSTIQSLILADVLANLSVKPLFDSGLLGDSVNGLSILTYFSDKVEIRILPYCDATLIGIPFVAYAEINSQDAKKVEMATDYMAIPHEVGHLFYQHGALNSDDVIALDNLFAIDEQSTKATKRKSHKVQQYVSEMIIAKLYDEGSFIASSIWILDWLQELFADAYGCVIAGPISVVSFQNTLSTSSPDYAFSQSDSHPIPVLRPLIQTRILRELRSLKTPAPGPNSNDDLDKLDDKWSDIVEGIWGIDSDTITTQLYDINGIRLTGMEIIEQVQTGIEVIAAVLNYLVVNKKEIKPWSTTINVNYDPDNSDIYMNSLSDVILNIELNNSIKNEVSWKRIYENLEDIRMAKQKRLKKRLQRRKKYNPEEDIDLDQKAEVNLDDLAEVILFSGWSDEGPKAGHDSGGGG